MKYFTEERGTIAAAGEKLQDAGVALAELATANTLGDPHLRETCSLAMLAADAARVAAHLARDALEAVDEAEIQEAAGSGEDV